MSTPNMLALVILAATRMAPRFANEDGELLFDFLVAEFPDLATDAADLIVRRVCANATAGFKSQKWDVVAADLFAEVSPWGDLTVVWA